MDIRESSAEILALSGYDVLQAQNGKEGMELIGQHPVDLILCDIMMPELDGFGVLYLLNKNPVTSEIPFVFLTAKAERKDIRKGMELGADDYLTKPFDDMELLLAVETRLNKKKQQELFYNKSVEKISNLMLEKNGLAEMTSTAEQLRVRSAVKGQVVYHEGDRPQGIYLVLSGKFKTTKVSDDGRELITGIYGKDDYIGIKSTLLKEAFDDSALVMEDGTYCLIANDTVDYFLANYTDVGKKFIEILSGNIHHKEEQLLQMAYYSVRKRMAEVLLNLAKQEPPALEDGYLKITRDEIASLAGIATETVSRILSDFTTEKLIEKKGRLIKIIDHERLLNLRN